jgi:hypothetical protein
VFSPVHTRPNIYLSYIHSLLLSCSFRGHISRGICNYRSSKGLLFFLTILYCICIVCSVSFVNSLRNFRLNVEPPKTTHILTFWITNLYIHIFITKRFCLYYQKTFKVFSLFHSHLKYIYWILKKIKLDFKLHNFHLSKPCISLSWVGPPVIIMWKLKVKITLKTA